MKEYPADDREWVVHYRVDTNKALARPVHEKPPAGYDVIMFSGTKYEALALLKKMKPKFFNKETNYEKREEGKAEQG